MNYAYLAKKYLNAEVIVHDRTFEGMEWLGPGEKPDEALFNSLQEEEDRQERLLGLKKQKELEIMKEKQAQWRAKHLEEIRPVEEKFREEEALIREEIERLRLSAVELEERRATKEKLLEAWNEITAAQHRMNEEAKQYLAETDWYVTREHDTGIKMPEDVKNQRQAARDSIQHGETVYSSWAALRAKEMPSRAEIKKAIELGGEALKKVKEACALAEKLYPKPKIRHWG